LSYNPCHFGEGFELANPSATMWRFKSLLDRQGLDATLIKRTVSTYDNYGQPETWTESEEDIKLFEHNKGFNVPTEAGDLMDTTTRFLTSICYIVSLDDLLLLNGVYYDIQAVLDRRAYLELWCKRRVNNG